ncbi:MAG: hypothetical protein GX858_04095 [Clostridiales bacterium]|nr:hypothetical protein [Clostridiales bacterium]
MERVYISVYKTEKEAVSEVDRLHAQGFRSDQIYVLTYNHDRFNTFYNAKLEQTPLPGRERKANRDNDIPDAVEDALKDEGANTAAAAPIAPAASIAPGGGAMFAPMPVAGYVPVTAWADLDLDDDTLRSNEGKYQSGDILVVLKTDEGQEYHPNMPAKK